MSSVMTGTVSDFTAPAPPAQLPVWCPGWTDTGRTSPDTCLSQTWGHNKEKNKARY